MNAKLAFATAVAGVAWLVAMVVLGGATFTGYDHVSQYISELGANGAPFGGYVSWLGFLPIGALICAFSYFAWRAAPSSLFATIGFIGVFLFSIGYVGSAFFPCDYGCRPDNPSFSQIMHELVGLAGYMLAPLTLLLLGVAALSWQKAMWLAVLGFIAAAGALIGLGGLLDADSPTVGLYQRVLECSMLAWVLACGIYLGVQKRTAAP